jgi:hypothetical protein
MEEEQAGTGPAHLKRSPEPIPVKNLAFCATGRLNCHAVSCWFQRLPNPDDRMTEKPLGAVFGRI